MNPTNVNEKKHVVWLDCVRLVAMFTVVCCHATDPFNFYTGSDQSMVAEIKSWGAIYGSLLRPCVPLFVMITGALLLPIHEKSGAFYKKRISRVFWPFLIWSVIYALFPWFMGVIGYGPQTILDFFPYSGEEVMKQSLEVSLTYIAQIPLNFSTVAVHMWYVYLLIGLYLYLPIFSAWVEKASVKEKRFFLLLWGVTLFVPYLRTFVNPYIWGACSWNEFHMLFYFAGFNGYLLLGHYLRHHVTWSTSKSVLLGILFFAAGFIVTYLGFREITTRASFTPEELELFFYYCSPNVALMTIAVFMLLKRVRIKNVAICNLLANLTKCGFGIYMVHYFLTGPMVLLTRTLQIPICIQIPIAAILAFAISWIFVALVYRVIGQKARILMG